MNQHSYSIKLSVVKRSSAIKKQGETKEILYSTGNQHKTGKIRMEEEKARTDLAEKEKKTKQSKKQNKENQNQNRRPTKSKVKKRK